MYMKKATSWKLTSSNHQVEIILVHSKNVYCLDLVIYEPRELSCNIYSRLYRNYLTCVCESDMPNQVHVDWNIIISLKTDCHKVEGNTQLTKTSFFDR